MDAPTPRQPTGNNPPPGKILDAPRVVIYANSSARPSRSRFSLITRLVALGAWLLIFLLIVSLLKHLQAYRQEETAPEPMAETPIPGQPPDEPAFVSEPEPAPLIQPPLIAEEDEAPPVSQAPPTTQVAQIVLSPAKNGNFYLEGAINGQKVWFVVDTGASVVSVPDKLRNSLRLNRGRYVQTATANGVAGMYETRIDSLSLGPIKLRNIDAVLINTPMPNDVTLLGMTALKELRLLHEDGKLILQKDISADAALDGESEAAPTRAQTPQMKRSVKECMGSDKVINQRVLECMRGEDEDTAQ